MSDVHSSTVKRVYQLFYRIESRWIVVKLNGMSLLKLNDSAWQFYFTDNKSDRGGDIHRRLGNLFYDRYLDLDTRLKATFNRVFFMVSCMEMILY